MNQLEIFLVKLGCSFTCSKFIVILLITIASCWIIRRLLSKKRRLIKWLVSILGMGAITALYILFNPIYQGDLFDEKEVIDFSAEFNEIHEDTLYVLSIPYCEYCEESVALSMQLKNALPDLAIQYRVDMGDSASINHYVELSNGMVDGQVVLNEDAIWKLTKGNYPTFVIRRNGKLLVWDTSYFGVRAFDQLTK